MNHGTSAPCSVVARTDMTCIQYFEEAGKLAPLATALVAMGAAWIAWKAIQAQKDIARRRAAIDFFLKVETDDKMIDVYETFKRESKLIAQGAPLKALVSSEYYGKVRGFLNLCELIAVGVRREAFSDSVSFHYWGDVLRDGFRDAKPLIDYVRKEEHRPATYVDLEWLCNHWKDRD
jgi:hypothetical protein